MKGEEPNELHLSRYDNPQWIVVDYNEMAILFTLSRRKTDSIKKFTDLWSKESPLSKWRNHKRKGYKCIKVELSIKQII